MQTLTVPGTLDSLEPIGKYVLAAAAEAGLDKKRSYALRLAVDEIATNSIVHGYDQAGLEGTLNVHADIDELALTITLEDSGAAFDPTTVRPPSEEDLSRPLEERPIGGLGVYLAIQGTDEFSYKRIGKRNRCTFIMNRATRGHLLVADDSKAHSEVLSRLLGRQGYTVTCVEDGEQALAVLGQTNFDLLLLDVDAPGKNAVQVLETLKADNALRGLPVIVLAAAENLQRIEECIQAGADDYVSEPFSALVLRARISANLQKQRVHLAEAALKESEKYERDAQIGRQIQLSFLPDVLPQPDGWEVAARFEPAREVAGDFYDAFPLSNNRIGLVLGDVCDKGVGAALFMALFRSLLRALGQQHYSSRLLDDLTDTPAGAGGQLAVRRRTLPSTGTLALKNAVELTNNYIVNNHGQTSMFATLFFGVLDPLTGSLLYVNGGHEPPVIFQQTQSGNGAGTPSISARLRPTGPAVGMMPDSDFEIRQAKLEPGDTMLIYTDGVTEAKDPNGKLFTEPRLLALLSEPDPSAAALLERIERNLRSHMAGAAQFDDITMLAVRRAPVSQ
jgi:serine phosphatase RsbU (regulator of sigma subunit)/anti-sigma regulatory factor (Ser/Thr protein kinase)